MGVCVNKNILNIKCILETFVTRISNQNSVIYPYSYLFQLNLHVGVCQCGIVTYNN